ncbi:hypothetical protein KM043_007515 [Ampulex compressa]|nr:hypothetical protein KM043_007515 [Ampulex compressa]
MSTRAQPSVEDQKEEAKADLFIDLALRCSPFYSLGWTKKTLDARCSSSCRFRLSGGAESIIIGQVQVHPVSRDSRVWFNTEYNFPDVFGCIGCIPNA